MEGELKVLGWCMNVLNLVCLYSIIYQNFYWTYGNNRLKYNSKWYYDKTKNKQLGIPSRVAYGSREYEHNRQSRQDIRCRWIFIGAHILRVSVTRPPNKYKLFVKLKYGERHGLVMLGINAHANARISSLCSNTGTDMSKLYTALWSRRKWLDRKNLRLVGLSDFDHFSFLFFFFLKRELFAGQIGTWIFI